MASLFFEIFSMWLFLITITMLFGLGGAFIFAMIFDLVLTQIENENNNE